MKTEKVIQSKLSRRYHSANSLLTGMSFKCLITVLILLTFFIARADNQPVDAESADALFIDEHGNVGIGTNQPTAELDVKGAIRGTGMVPPGGIIMFSGNIGAAFDPNGTGIKGSPYQGWQVCNGNNNSPDLRDRFIVAAGSRYAAKETGGLDAVVLTPAEMPSHSHSGTVAQGASHVHTYKYPNDRKGVFAIKNNDWTYFKWNAFGRENVSGDGSHEHTLIIKEAGGGKPHENRPPFYALAFIMRLP